MGTAIPLFFRVAFLHPWYVCRVLNIKLKNYLIEIFKILFMSCFIFVFGLAVANQFLQPTYLRISFLAGLYSLIYAGFVFCSGLSKTERSLFFKLIFDLRIIKK